MKICTCALKLVVLKLLHVMIVLVDNAIEAMTDLERDRRRLTVTLNQEQGRACLEFRDLGRGLEVESHQLFQAGFSTKPDGSGMSLHRSANFIKEMGGRLEINVNAPDPGITAKLCLPLERLAKNQNS